MRNLMKLRSMLVVLVILFLFSACQQSNSAVPPVSPEPKDKAAVDGGDDHEGNNTDTDKDADGTKGTDKGQEIEEEGTQQPEPIDFEKVKPNELGEVMVLMYHYFGETEKDVWWRSFDHFRKDLALLYERGYRLISMDDFISNNIDVAAGMTPIIFTFDDGHISQFNLIEKDGEQVIEPNSAVGIMQAFYKEHPDFGMEGTFYTNEAAFAGSKVTEKEMLQYLLDLGMDIGNHTFGHTNLGRADASTIQKVIAQHVKKMKGYFPDYSHNTLALPFGSYAGATFDYIIQGQYQDIHYKNDAILAVGSNPSPPPGHKNFKPLYMPRVRASESDGKEPDMYYYLDYFEKYPERRYISDGNKDTLCFPEKDKDNLDEQRIGDKQIITY